MSIEPRWNDTDRETRRTRIKPCPSATLPTTNPIWTDPNANPGLRCEKLAANRHSDGTAKVGFTREQRNTMSDFLLLYMPDQSYEKRCN
jgi:hypothetical protein